MAIKISGTTVIDNSRAITNVTSYSGPGIASQSEAEAGTNNNQLMTPLRVKQAIAALGGGSVNVQRFNATVPTSSSYSSSYPVTISSVDPDKTFITNFGFTVATLDSQWPAGSGDSVRARLTSPTNVELTYASRPNPSYPYAPRAGIQYYSFEVVEFE